MMPHLKHVKVKNLLLYGEAEFDFDQTGISYITGVNQNSEVPLNEKGEKEDDPNGTGKSLLFSLIATLRYRDSLGNTRKDAFTALFGKDSEVDYEYTSGKTNWRILKSGGKKRFTVYKDGVDIEARTPTIAEALIDESLDWSEEEFYTYVYLDSRRPSVFQTGTATSRFAYFTSIFRELSEYDRYQSDFNKLQAQLVQVQRDKALREKDLEELGAVEDTTDTKSELKAVRKQLDAIEGKLEAGRTAAEDKKLADRYGDDLKLAADYSKKELKRLNNLHREWSDYKAALPTAQEVKQLREEALKLLAEGNKLFDTDFRYDEQGVDEYNGVVDDAFTDYNRERAIWDTAYRDYERAISDTKNLERDRSSAREIVAKIPKTRKVEVIESEIDRLEEQNERLRVHKAGECDVCGSHLDAKSAKDQLAKNNKTLDKLDSELEKAKEASKLKDKLERLWNPEKEKLLKKLSKVEKPGKKPIEPKAEEIRFIKQVKAVKPSTNQDEIKQARNAQQRAKDAYTRVEPIKDRIEAGLKVSDKAVSDYKKLSKQAEELRGTIYSLERKVGIAEEQRRNRRKLEEEIAEYDIKLQDKGLVDSFAEAFSKKGLKVGHVKALAKDIQDNLNKYAPLLFAEPFLFEMIVDANQFDVIVERPGGIKSDVRRLSGAESRQFSLLWMIAIIPLIPAERRVNVVILDEFEAGMGAPRRRMLREQFLPQLTKVVPHVVFISPFAAIAGDNQRVYVVEKTGNQSTIRLKETAL